LIFPPFFFLFFLPAGRERGYTTITNFRNLFLLSRRATRSLSGNDDNSASDKQKERERGRKALYSAFVRTSSRFWSRCCSVKSYQNFLISHAARHAQNCFSFKKKNVVLFLLWGSSSRRKTQQKMERRLSRVVVFLLLLLQRKRTEECGRARVIGDCEIFFLFYNGKKKEELSYLGFH
jgi:hypothetical protein